MNEEQKAKLRGKITEILAQENPRAEKIEQIVEATEKVLSGENEEDPGNGNGSGQE